jgi:alkanesulfonate monooxygenase SsuD/methylene tetrahydromethanopterin reductase-like flavin-dependent oxidoreductase (luciferase family)
MKFGVFDHMDSTGGALGEQYEDRLKLIEAYDRAGFYAYHVAEHHATPLGVAPSPSVFLAAVAQRTKRLRFGPLVYTLGLYHPFRLLEEIAMLDQMSGGRFELGVGRGISPIEIGYYGIDPDEAAERFREALQILLQGMSAETLTFEGRFYRFRDVPVLLHPLQQPHPPLWYGLNRPESAAYAAQQGLNIGCNLPLARARAVTDAYRAAWLATGKSLAAIPLMGMTRHIVVAETDAEAMAIARRAYLRWRASFMHLWVKHNRAPVAAVYPETFDELQSGGSGVAGAPQTVRDLLARHIAETGINYLFCRLAFGDLSLDESRRSLDLMAREVIPALQA